MIFLIVVILMFAAQTSFAQVNVQCVIVAASKAANHVCNARGPIGCAAEKTLVGVARYFECTNPVSTLRNYRRNPSASIRAQYGPMRSRLRR